MGKSLKGKELGKGIVQRKDGKYSGRYTGADGNRYERVCDKLRDARAFVQIGNSEKKGYGIGLSMASEMVQKFKGKIAVTYKDGMICFTVTI